MNGNPITWGPPVVDVPDGATIRMPGLYEDGDGGAHVGYTYSDIDDFSVMPDLPTAVGTVGWAIESWGSVKNRYR